MAEMLSSNRVFSDDSLKKQLEKIVEMSKERQEKDNITVLGIKLEDDSWDLE